MARVVTVVPYRTINGNYLTGLSNDERIELEALTGLDLSETSTYYSGVFDAREDILKAPIMRFNGSSPKIFYRSNPIDRINYAWLSVHPERKLIQILLND